MSVLRLTAADGIMGNDIVLRTEEITMVRQSTTSGNMVVLHFKGGQTETLQTTDPARLMNRIAGAL